MVAKRDDKRGMTRPPVLIPRGRSRREWAIRGGLAAAALALGYASTIQTFAFALSGRDAERAYSLAPSDGRVVGAFAQQLAATEAEQPSMRKQADALARTALEAEPIGVKALTALGLGAQIAGDTATARRLFVHSDRLSRRELGTRLWLIEDAVSRGDVPAALRHYDIALRTEKTAPDLLFPILTAAVDDPAIAVPLARLLSGRPPWGESFVGYLGEKAPNPVVGARFFALLRRAGASVPEVPQVGIVNGLAAAGSLERAWAFYNSFHRGLDRRRSRDADFADRRPAPTVFDWIADADQPGITTSIAAGGFDFAAPASTGGTVLQQTQLLPPGRYRLDGISADIEQPDDSRPFWQILCIGGRELGRVQISNSSENSGRFSGTFVVPAGCSAQLLKLTILPSMAVGGVSGSIRRVEIAPAETRL